jgi:hypothetical protein
MGTKDETESAVIRAPRRGEVYQLASSASTQVFAAPASWKGKKVRFEAIGDNFWILTAPDVSITINPLDVNTVTANALSAADVNIGEPISNGQYKEFDFTEVDAYVGIIGTGATLGKIVFRESETALGST